MGLTRAELSILLTGDEEIRALNADYRNQDKPTDVLSFPLADPDELAADYDGPLGDIVISLETATRQAADDFHRERLGASGAWSEEEELLFLLVHGTLHLTGHDHEEEVEARKMEAEERRLFALIQPRRAGRPFAA